MHDLELSSLKVRLSRAECKVVTLEGSLKAKCDENVELSRICDDLVLQIEDITK